MLRELYRLFLQARYLPETVECRKLLMNDSYGPEEFQRIYFYHIRKTGGSSLVRAFLGMGGEEYRDVYRELVNRPIHRVLTGNKVIVGWRQFLIEGGHYSFAFSHIPYHKLTLPPKTMTFTILRDPFKRAFSHYKVLNNFSRMEQPPGHLVDTELNWIGKTMDDFLDNVPKHHLLNQLYMFSDRYDVNEAFDRVMSCSHCMFTEDFNEGVTKLAQKVGFTLDVHHVRKSSIGDDVDTSATERLREMLAPEFEFYQKLRRELGLVS